jgi:hypothetical protein
MGTIMPKRDRFLLDTHVLLWWLFNDSRLSERAVQVISTPGNTILVSSVSAWEISTKLRLGKLSGVEHIGITETFEKGPDGGFTDQLESCPPGWKPDQ